MSLSLKSLQTELEEVIKLIDGSKITLEEGRKTLISLINVKGVKLSNNASFQDVINAINSKIPIKRRVQNALIEWKIQQAPPKPSLTEVTSNSIKVTTVNGAKIRFNGVDYNSPKTFTGLKSNTEYTFYTFYPQDDSKFLLESPVSHNKISTLANIPGPSKLIKGTKEAGYYGVTNGIITGREIFAETGITNGNAVVTGDITWLKFNHKGTDNKYRTLFIADRVIRNNITWDHINSKGYAYGKEITINGRKYKLRLIKGLHEDPSPNSEQYSNASRKFPGSEWDDLIANLVPEDDISNWKNISTWCQERTTTYRVRRGFYDVSYFGTNSSSNTNLNYGWRPVLEVL